MSPLVLEGRWRLGPIIARGRYSVVCEADDLTTGGTVAVKLHTAKYLARIESKDVFFREAEALAELVHPNLMRVLGAGEHGGLLFLVMERIRGVTLAELLGEVRALPLPELVPIARDVLDGLGALHATGRVHRDVKPGNLMVDPAGRGVVIDYGLLRAADLSFAAHGIVEGTPEYMAPEQARGLRFADHRSDLYALGATLYAALVGRPPFSGASPEELFRKHHVEKATPPSQLVPGLPRSVDKLLAKAMAKHRLFRFQSAASMKKALLALT